MKTVFGWIAVAGSVLVGVGLLVARLMGEVYSTSLYVRAAIILPLVLLYGLSLIRAHRRTNNASLE